MNTVLKVLNFRHACKKFDPEKKIPQEQLEEIMECARLSPTSFGIEAWKFLVIESDTLKQKIRPACWDQPQITDSSHVVIILSAPTLVNKDSEHVRQMFARRGLDEETTNAYVQRYGDFHANEVAPRMNEYAWCSKQCYIGLANIMTAAAAVNIDSCPIEGFDKNELEQALELATDKEQVSVVVALGYRASEQPARFRRAAAEIIEYRS